MPDDLRPRRSVLYMPAANERALEKAKSIPADAIIFDLEDAVAPDAKPDARGQAVAAVQSGEYGSRELTIRCNGLDTEWGADDIAAAGAANPSAVVIPKVDSLATIDEVSERLDAAGAAPDVKIWPMIETPTAIFDVRELAAHPRVAVLIMGTNDLAKELRSPIVPGRHPLLPHLGDGAARRTRSGQGRDRRRLQRREGSRRLPRRVRSGHGDGLRRQDADPPEPGRSGERHLGAGGRGDRPTPSGSSRRSTRPSPRARAS